MSDLVVGFFHEARSGGAPPSTDPSSGRVHNVFVQGEQQFSLVFVFSQMRMIDDCPVQTDDIPILSFDTT